MQFDLQINRELDRLRKTAEKKGLPYQSLVNEILAGEMRKRVNNSRTGMAALASVSLQDLTLQIAANCLAASHQRPHRVKGKAVLSCSDVFCNRAQILRSRRWLVEEQLHLAEQLHAVLFHHYSMCALADHN